MLRAADGSILGPAHLEAVQLLPLTVDAPPTPRIVRVVARGSRLIVAPSITADEGAAHHVMDGRLVAGAFLAEGDCGHSSRCPDLSRLVAR